MTTIWQTFKIFRSCLPTFCLNVGLVENVSKNFLQFSTRFNQAMNEQHCGKIVNMVYVYNEETEYPVILVSYFKRAKQKMMRQGGYQSNLSLHWVYIIFVFLKLVKH